jgi:hypothetical protein
MPLQVNQFGVLGVCRLIRLEHEMPTNSSGLSAIYPMHFAIWGVSPIFGQSHLSSFIIIYPYLETPEANKSASGPRGKT